MTTHTTASTTTKMRTRAATTLRMMVSSKSEGESEDTFSQFREDLEVSLLSIKVSFATNVNQPLDLLFPLAAKKPLS